MNKWMDIFIWNIQMTDKKINMLFNILWSILWSDYFPSFAFLTFIYLLTCLLINLKNGTNFQK